MITFRDLKEDDYKLLHKWIKTNQYVKKWYFFDKQPRLETLRKKFLKRIENKENWIIKIVQIDRIDIGYIQGYTIEDNGNWTKQVKIYENTVSIDFYIGNIEYIHKGYGKLMINAFIDEFIKENYRYVMISPDPSNKVSISICEKCGLKYIKTVGIPYDNSKNKEAIYIKEVAHE